MDALNNILNRVSARELAQPYPSNDEMKLVYQAALRAPDHAWLRPSSFIEVKGEGLDRLSKIFHEYALTLNDLSEEIINKYKNAPYRAPMIIILVSTFKEHPKVPSIEQKLSTATAAQNISLALNAMKYSCIWRTGKLAFNKTIQEKLGLSTNQEILGYLYVGTEIGKKKKIPSLDIDDFVSYL
jgi:nitroreductase|tara:strand:- start:3517 stop:4068 length:552 start_codon:yes stop_codon:yes gene_type:complete